MEQEITEIEDELPPLTNIKTEYDSHVNAFVKLNEQINKRLELVQAKENHWNEMVKRMDHQASLAKDKIVLDVGGTRFATTKETLLSQEGTFFHAMLSSGRWLPGDDGMYFIDRNPHHMQIILDFLRMRQIDCSSYTMQKIITLKEDLDFFQIQNFPLHTGRLLPDSPLLQDWLPNKRFQIIYAASKDGFRASDFHSKCDNKGPTLTLISSTTNHLFGGFAPLSWDSTNTYKSHPDAFLFTLLNPHSIPPTRYKLHPTTHSHAMSCGSANGVMFGAGNDMLVSGDASSNNCCFNFPHTYADTTGKGKLTFTGASTFACKEVEVYAVY